MERINVAYDLSFYESEQERHIARKEKKQGILIKARSKFALGQRIAGVLSIAVLFSLIIGVIATNAAIAGYSSKIARVNEDIVQLESQRSYLQFTLDSRMTLDEIESYAINELGMVKMDASQKKYVELKNENKIVVNDSSVKEKLTKAIQPVMSYLLP